MNKLTSSVPTIALIAMIIGIVIYWFAYTAGVGQALFPDAEQVFASQTNSTITAWNKMAPSYNVPVVVKPNIGKTPEQIAEEEAAAAQAQAEAEAAAQAQAEAEAAAIEAAAQE